VIPAWHIVIRIAMPIVCEVMTGKAGPDLPPARYYLGKNRRRTECFAFPPDSFKVATAT